MNKIKIKMDIYLYYIKVRKTLLRKHHKGNAKVIKKKTDRFKNIKEFKTINEKGMRNYKLEYLLHTKKRININNIENA